MNTDAGMAGGISNGNPTFWGGNKIPSQAGATQCRRLNAATGNWEYDCAYLRSHGRIEHVVYPLNENDLWLMGELSKLAMPFIFNFVRLCCHY